MRPPQLSMHSSDERRPRSERADTSHRRLIIRDEVEKALKQAKALRVKLNFNYSVDH